MRDGGGGGGGGFRFGGARDGVVGLGLGGRIPALPCTSGARSFWRDGRNLEMAQSLPYVMQDWDRVNFRAGGGGCAAAAATIAAAAITRSMLAMGLQQGKTGWG
jgi:hypothetical protein